MNMSNAPSVLKLPQDLTFAKAVACTCAFNKELRAAYGNRAHKQIVLDASAVEHFDSSALAVLMQLRRDVMALGGQGVVVASMPTRLRELSELYGVASLFLDAS